MARGNTDCVGQVSWRAQQNPSEGTDSLCAQSLLERKSLILGQHLSKDGNFFSLRSNSFCLFFTLQRTDCGNVAPFWQRSLCGKLRYASRQKSWHISSTLFTWPLLPSSNEDWPLLAQLGPTDAVWSSVTQPNDTLHLMRLLKQESWDSQPQMIWDPEWAGD